jgi:hypothetical protein
MMSPKCQNHMTMKLRVSGHTVAHILRTTSSSTDSEFNFQTEFYEGRRLTNFGHMECLSYRRYGNHIVGALTVRIACHDIRHVPCSYTTRYSAKWRCRSHECICEVVSTIAVSRSSPPLGVIVSYTTQHAERGR